MRWAVVRFVVVFAVLFTSSLLPASSALDLRGLTIGIGNSLPAKTNNGGILENVEKIKGGGITRTKGGEEIELHFADMKTNKPHKYNVRRMTLYGYSASGQGAVLVRHLSAGPKLNAKIFEPLYKFGKVSEASKTHKIGDLVLLKSGDYVTVDFKEPVQIQTLKLVVETYWHSDASIAIDLIYDHDSSRKNAGVISSRRVLNPKPRPTPKPTIWPDDDCGGPWWQIRKSSCEDEEESHFPPHIGEGVQCWSSSDCPMFASCENGWCVK